MKAKAAVLMTAAYPNRTSPVVRGSFILMNLEGVRPANPPKVVLDTITEDLAAKRTK